MVPQAELLKAEMDLAPITGTSPEPSRIAIGTWAIGGWMWGGTEEAQPVDEVGGWWLDAPAKAEIDGILRATIADPVGPEFMAPPPQSIAA
jgi:hypothetical protein